MCGGWGIPQQSSNSFAMTTIVKFWQHHFCSHCGDGASSSCQQSWAQPCDQVTSMERWGEGAWPNRGVCRPSQSHPRNSPPPENTPHFSYPTHTPPHTLPHVLSGSKRVPKHRYTPAHACPLTLRIHKNRLELTCKHTHTHTLQFNPAFEAPSKTVEMGFARQTILEILRAHKGVV